jgi:hypothetical protein
MTTTSQVNALSFLTDLEKDSLQAFIQNEAMREGLKKVLLDQMLHMGVQKGGEETLMLRNWVFGLDPRGTMTDDQYGRAIRVHTEALVLLEQAFNKVQDLVEAPAPEKKKNPAL